MKLIELIIDENDKELGLSKISIVDSPAIETNFFWFGAEEYFIEPRPDEERDSFVGRCIANLVSSGEATDPSQAAAICYSKWESFEVDTSGLPSYTQQVESAKKRKKERMAKLENSLTLKVEEWKDDEVFAFAWMALAKAGEAPVDWEILYRYDGEGPERTFCDRYWTREFSLIEILAMEFDNPGFGLNGADGYDKFLYKGGPNCKHSWHPSKLRVFYKDGKSKLIDYQEQWHKDILLDELSLFGYSSSDLQIARTPMYKMPNHGYAKPRKKEKMSKVFAFQDEEQRIIVSPVMIPNKKIIRKDPETEELYHVYFSEETIRKMSEKYFRELKIHEVTEMHDDKRPSEWTMLESWIIEDPQHDKSSVYGFELPKGTWMVSCRILDDEAWKKVKDGTFKGVSLEGRFMEKEVA